MNGSAIEFFESPEIWSEADAINLLDILILNEENYGQLLHYS